MKLTKAWIGKEARVLWWDPRYDRVTSHSPKDHRDVPRGRAALARWTCYGLVEDITDGVLMLRKGMGEDPPGDQDPSHECEYDWIPEDLIISLTEMSPGAVTGEGTV